MCLQLELVRPNDTSALCGGLWLARTCFDHVDWNPSRSFPTCQKIIGASDFDASALSCRWEFVVNDDNWTVSDDLCVWCHPLEAHFSTSSIQGWPQLSVQVWEQDELDRGEIAGYGCCRIPVEAGIHELEIVTWAPEGGFMERLAAKLLGARPQLEHPDLVTDVHADRCELHVASRGSVHVEVQVLVKGFEEHGVVLSDTPSGVVGRKAKK